MRRDLAGKRALITGSTGGIGKPLCDLLAEKGCRLALVARSRDRVEAQAAELSGRGAEAFAVPADVTSPEDRRRIADAVRERWGVLDLLVNNAGREASGHFATSTEEILRAMMEVNFFAPVELTRLCVPLLEKGDRPGVVNIGSRCGRRGLPARTEYSAAKAALYGMSEALRGELHRFGVRVMLVTPGLTATAFRDNSMRNEARMSIEGKGMRPEYVARKVVRAIEADREETTIGAAARWLLRVNRFLPGLVDRIAANRVRRMYAND